MKIELKIGDKVKMINCGEADHYKEKIWVCRTDSFYPEHYKKDNVVMLEGFAGWFLCEYLKKIL